jgi:K+-transporting ATPase KdpF subunit
VTADNVIALIVAVVLLGYLLVSLIDPDRF